MPELDTTVGVGKGEGSGTSSDLASTYSSLLIDTPAEESAPKLVAYKQPTCFLASLPHNS